MCLDVNYCLFSNVFILYPCGFSSSAPQYNSLVHICLDVNHTVNKLIRMRFRHHSRTTFIRRVTDKCFMCESAIYVLRLI